MAITTTPGRLSPGSLACAYPRSATILGAILADLVVWAIAVYIGQVDLMVNGEDVFPLDVIMGVLIPGLAGWGLLAFLERRTRRAWTIWLTIALIVTVVSMAGPLSAETASGKTTLSVMHAFAAAIIIRGFARTVRRGR